MHRTLTHHTLWSALFVLSALLTGPALADLSHSEYGPVILRAHVLDRQGHPVRGLPLRFSADLHGVALQDDGRSEGILTTAARSVPTDAAGIATLRLSGSPWTHEPRWYRGQIRLSVSLPQDPKREISPLGDGSASETLTFPEIAPTVEPLTLSVFEEPDLTVEGFPLWAATNGRTDRIVVALEGFDLYNRISATDMMALIAPAGDALRAHGVSLMMVHFPDSHLAPDKLVPRATQAIEAAARASGHPVAVVGLSAGGIVARWALVEAEERGTPLPVHTLMTFDTPNRGARMNPQIQAIVLRYGTRADKAALASEAARVLLRGRPSGVQWKWIGLPEMGREMPVRAAEDTREHDAFYDRLHHLNDHNGYPKRVRLIGVSSGSRRGGATPGDLMRLWVPWTYGWALPAAPADLAPGSVLPRYFVSRFTTVFPLGLAGATLRTDPTFIPTESALDAGPGETPPFDAWYARPDNAPPIAHDEVAQEEATFVVRQMLAAGWEGQP